MSAFPSTRARAVIVDVAFVLVAYVLMLLVERAAQRAGWSSSFTWYGSRNDSMTDVGWITVTIVAAVVMPLVGLRLWPRWILGTAVLVASTFVTAVVVAFLVEQMPNVVGSAHAASAQIVAHTLPAVLIAAAVGYAVTSLRRWGWRGRRWLALAVVPPCLALGFLVMFAMFVLMWDPTSG